MACESEVEIDSKPAPFMNQTQRLRHPSSKSDQEHGLWSNPIEAQVRGGNCITVSVDLFSIRTECEGETKLF
jgi:hypothetical protein